MPDEIEAHGVPEDVALARVISEREVSKGLRRTPMTQARRLERLATRRFHEIGGTVPTVQPSEEV
jgi:hypothetical protein